MRRNDYNSPMTARSAPNKTSELPALRLRDVKEKGPREGGGITTNLYLPHCRQT